VSDDVVAAREEPAGAAAPEGAAGTAPEASPVSSAAAGEERASLSLGELIVFAAAVLVGLVALVSLAAAHLHHHTPAVVGSVSVILVIAVLVLVYRFDRRPVRLDLAGLLPIVFGLAFAALMLFPGFQYGTGDRDPGAYVEHAVAISRTGGITFPDDLVQQKLPGGVSPGAEWPAMWDAPGHPGQIFPQFYHLWPALMATAKDAGGFTGLFNTGPLVAVIAICLAIAVARRLAGLPAAWAVGALLSSNMLQVWQAKYPSSEIFGQMLFVAALLGVVLAIRTGSRAAAFAAGCFVSLSFLERADGVVVIVISWIALCALLAARRFDRRAAWFTVGLLLLLPYAFYQAYDLARAYTLVNGVPTMAKVLEGMIGLAVLAALLAWRPQVVQRLTAVVRNRTVQLWLGSVFVGVSGLLALIGGLRPILFGQDFLYYGTRRIRSYDEISLIRLSWFFSIPGMCLMFGGFMYVAWRKWRFDLWLLALPTAGLLTLYCYHVRNSPYLMWATRRFVTTVVPSMVLMMGFGAALAIVLLRRFLPKLVALGVVAAFVIGLVVFNLSESWPLRSHNENGGSIEIEMQVAALAGSQKGVFVWERTTYCCNSPYQLFGGPLFTIAGQSSALLPTRPGPAAVLTTYVDHFKSTSRPVFYIADKKGAPPNMPGVTTTKVTEIAGVLPHWEETYITRPKKRHDYPFDFTVYRLTAS
jgi:hypothetical protein